MENKEEMKICPYNTSHIVEPLKYAKHLQRCRKANPRMRIDICPYNSTHHIPRHSLKLHFEICEDRVRFSSADDILFRESAAASLQAGACAPTTQFASFDPEDDWEAEAAASTGPAVNPEISILYSTNSRLPDASLGLGKSGRRNWRRIDALRIERIKNNQPIEDLEYPTADGGWISIGEMVFGSAWRECGHNYGEDDLSNLNKSSKEIEDNSLLDDSTTKKKKKRRKKKRPVQSNVESSDPSVDETIPPIRFERGNIERKNLQVRFQDPSIERKSEKPPSGVETSTKKKKKKKPKQPSVEEKMRFLNLEPN